MSVLVKARYCPLRSSKTGRIVCDDVARKVYTGTKEQIPRGKAEHPVPIDLCFCSAGPYSASRQTIRFEVRAPDVGAAFCWLHCCCVLAWRFQMEIRMQKPEQNTVREGGRSGGEGEERQLA